MKLKIKQMKLKNSKKKIRKKDLKYETKNTYMIFSNMKQ